MSSERLYDTDFYAWTQQQAERLREVRDNRLDAENLAEEVADLGKSELRAVNSHLESVLVHLMKAGYSPADQPRSGWLNEADSHQDLARQAFWPSMRDKIDLGRLWRRAIRQTNRELTAYDEAQLAADTPCPFTLDELLSEEFDVDAALKRLTP
ncbi:MAG: DUF29 domain-containing protein [Rhodovibrio sp.]|nr:DUF29 domain-containing protein [Rhodovibrio sp.]